MASEYFSNRTLPPVGKIHSFTFGFENNFDPNEAFNLYHDQIHLPTITGTIIYLPLIYLGQMLMKNREPFKLKGPLMLWNFALALYSFVSFVRLFPEFLYVYEKEGFYGTICNNDMFYIKSTSWWIKLILISKFWDLIDTAFLVLRKKKLIFLHVYHHATALIFTWYSIAFAASLIRWLYNMNLAIHSVMYLYYGLASINIRIPKWISIIITTTQITQMAIGFYIASAVYYYRIILGNDCQTTQGITIFTFVLYFTYLFLFAQFFKRSYLDSKPSSSERTSSSRDKKRS